MSAPSKTLVPGPGSVVPVAIRVRFDQSHNNSQVLRVVVTTPIRAGTVLGFRFYTPTDGYLSPYSTTVTFATSAVLAPGDFLQIERLAPGSGTALVCIQFPEPCSEPVCTVVGSTTTDLPNTLNGNSCFMYYAPTKCGAPIVALAVVTGSGPGASDPIYLPPPCTLPCQYAFSPNVPVGPSVDYLVLGPGVEEAKGGAIPGTWSAMWQLARYRAWAAYDETVRPWRTIVNALSGGLYLAPPPGAMIPLGARSYLAGSSFLAQLVLVATTTIAAGTVFQVSASTAIDPAPYWEWTSPLDADLPPGSVVDMSGLGLVAGSVPSVNVGTIVALEVVDPPDGNLTEFTVFTVNPCNAEDSAARSYVTAVYTCARPTGDCLPPGLVVGTDMPAAPWPAPAAVLLPVSGIKPTAWPMAAWALNHVCPVPWTIQPVPCFRTSISCTDNARGSTSGAGLNNGFGCGYGCGC